MRSASAVTVTSWPWYLRWHTSRGFLSFFLGDFLVASTNYSTQTLWGRRRRASVVEGGLIRRGWLRWRSGRNSRQSVGPPADRHPRRLPEVHVDCRPVHPAAARGDCQTDQRRVCAISGFRSSSSLRPRRSKGALPPLDSGWKHPAGHPVYLPCFSRDRKTQRLAPCPAPALPLLQMLDTQYRMHPRIREFPSLHFYGGNLKDGPDMAAATARPWHACPAFQPLTFYDVRSKVRCCSWPGRIGREALAGRGAAPAGRTGKARTPPALPAAWRPLARRVWVPALRCKSLAPPPSTGRNQPLSPPRRSRCRPAAPRWSTRARRRWCCRCTASWCTATPTCAQARRWGSSRPTRRRCGGRELI